LDWEEGEKSSAPPHPTPSTFPDFGSYYRAFPALHPRHPFDSFADNNGNTVPTLQKIVFTDSNRNHVRAIPNVKLSLEVLKIGGDTLMGGGLPFSIRLHAAWQPALPEMRSFTDPNVRLPPAYIFPTHNGKRTEYTI